MQNAGRSQLRHQVRAEIQHLHPAVCRIQTAQPPSLRALLHNEGIFLSPSAI